SGAMNYGVHASATGSGATNWAGYFTGSVYSPYGTWQPSDENLKSDIAELEPQVSAELLNALRVHSYRYNTESYPQMALPEGQQVGLLAQELEEVLPGAVRAAVEPAVQNEDGQVIHEAVEFKAVNYGVLIPYLVAAYQHEQSRSEQLEERLSLLEERLNACCTIANPDRAIPQPAGTNSTPASELRGGAEKLHIQPNPFNESTTVYYTLERGGRAQLMANSADGKELRVLHEASLEQGSYQYEWNTTDLAAGMYYVTLLVDGRPVVKKAVKVDR
ncbi:MAG: tail fiber domain-containing protein, partial [Flavobacteriales bacterium]|nr:tail fiber domain-containing protein [Flavobacteriales bacterium]